MVIAETTDWFTISANPRTRQVSISLSGLWNDAAFASFAQALTNTINGLVAAGAPFGSYRTMLDLREQTILTQPVAELAKGLTTGPGAASERIAIVVANTLQKLQQHRIATVDNIKVFVDYAEAERWVFSHD